MNAQKTIVTLLLVAVVNSTVSAQIIDSKDPFKLSNNELGDLYMHKSKSRKGSGYALLGLGAGLMMAGTAIALNDFWEGGNGGLVVGLWYAGMGSMAASYPVLSSGARAKGQAEIYYMNPDRAKAEELTATYRRKANTNAVVAWALLGTGFIVPLINQNTDPSKTTQAVNSIASLGIFVSLPFFMEAAKNKGRVSVLVGSERVPGNVMNSSGTMRSVGLAFPIGK